MKVQTIQRRINRNAVRLLAICAAVLVGVASSNATAQSPVQREAGRQLNIDGKNYQVVGSGSVKTAGDLRGPIGSAIANGGAIAQTACSSCNSGGSCGGNCNSGSCGSYSASTVGHYGGAMACGPTCNPYRYGMIESLHMELTDYDNLTYSPDFNIPSFDFETAARITVGTLPDCVHGCEVTFTGVMEWDRVGTIVDLNNDVQTFLRPVGALTNADLGAFHPDNLPPLNPPVTGATTQSQVYEVDYWSVEANKTLVGWDVAKILFGARYLNWDEEFNYSSRLATLLPTSRLRSQVDNQMFGIQGGLELLYPIGKFAYADFRSRAGLFLNFIDSDVQMVTQPHPAGSAVQRPIANFDSDEDIAGIIEIGSGFRYQLGESLAIRGGTEFWYLSGIASAPSQLPYLISGQTGRSVSSSDDVFIYGLTLGAEFRH